jgi:dTDP-4-amino-4,6-dideoxygalactose transaminase
MINVTQPFLPPLSEYQEYLSRIWENKILTNGGSMHQELEAELCRHLGVEHISLFSNGTIALITALQALEISGEVITTPYSFVATTNALIWNGIQPVFVDIDPATCNMDCAKIEAAITPQTSAIMPVHVYGVPCNVEEIERIAKKHSLKVLYDAAHAFGVNACGKSVLAFGDMAVLSFHATKVFNTVEGGAIISQTREMKEKIDSLKNFGITNEVTVVAPGINGKMNEFQAAFGLLNLRYLDKALAARREQCELYCKLLSSVRGVRFLDTRGVENYNYAYFPVFINPEEFGTGRDDVYFALRKKGINGRRYFYPLITDFPIYKNIPSAAAANLPRARKIADEVICLPVYPELGLQNVERIVGELKAIQEEAQQPL